MESPVSWVVLAASRKELDSLVTGAKPVDTKIAAVTTAAAVVNQPPVVDPSSTYVDQATGTITGTLGATDPENKKLTYTLKTGPAVGKLIFDTKTGTFTYTPTTAQRILTAVGSPQTATFTATVSDGVAANARTVEVTLNISGAPISDKGVLSIGSNSPDGSVAVTNTRAYVSNSDEHTITVVDTINRRILGAITLDETPSGLAVTPDGKKLYVTDDTTNIIYVYNAAPDTPTFLHDIDFGANRYPLGFSMSPDGKTLLVTGGLYDAKTDLWNTVVTKVSTTTDKITGTVKLPGASDSFYDLQFTPDGKKIYAVADLLSDDPDAVAVSALYSFSSSATSAKQIATGTYIIELAISPDGKRVYVNDVDAGTVSVFDTKTDKVVDSFTTPVSTLSGFTISRDGTVLYAVDTATNAVVAFETVSGNYAQLARVSVGSTTADFYPRGFASPDGQELYYTSDTGLQIISLVPPNDFPTATTTVSTPSAAGIVTGAVGGNDTNGDYLKYTTTGAPTKGTLVLNATTGLFTYTPTAAARHAASALTATIADKTDTFTVTIDDGRRGIITKTITVDVLGANVRPTAKATAGSPNSATGVVTVSVVGTDKDKDPLTYTVGGTSAKGGTVTIDAKGKFVYTPTGAIRHAAAATGATTADKTDNFTVTVADGHGEPVTITVSVKIAPANSKPTGANAHVAQPVNGVVTGTISADDTDLDDFTLTGPSSTKKGTIAYDSATDSFVFTPTAAARLAAGAANASAATKTDKFTVTISDGHGGTTTAAVTVDIAPNAAPVPGTSTVNPPSGAQMVVTGTVHATDPNGDTITYGLKSPLASTIGEVVVDAATGQWAFKPSGLARYNAYFTSADDNANFSIVASDGAGGTAEIKVVAPIDPAVVVSYEDVRDLAGSRPGSIAIAKDGRIYVADLGGSETSAGVTVLEPDGSVHTVGLGGFTASGVAVSSTGQVYVAAYGVSDSTLTTQVSLINPNAGYTTTPFASVTGLSTAIGVGSGGKLYVATYDFVAGTSKVTILTTAGKVSGTLAFDGFVGGIAAGPSNKTYFTVDATDGTTGSLVIVSSNNSRKTVNLGVAALGVAVDSTGRAYVTTAAVDGVGQPIGASLKVVNPDYSVTAATALDGDAWYGLTFAPDGKLWGTNGSANTADQIELVQPWQGDYQYGDVDYDTGAVHGVLLAIDPGHHYTYSVTTAADPALGTVTVNSSTGDWVFTPTPDARLQAAASGDDLWATFTISGTYGTTVKPIAVEAWVEPFYDGALEYQATTSSVDFVPFGLAATAGGRLVATGIDYANQTTGTLNIVQADGTVTSTPLGFLSAGVVVRPDGKALVTDYVAGVVRLFDLSNPATSTVFATGLPSATGIALDGSGRVYVTSAGAAGLGKLAVLNANGTEAWSVDLPSQAVSLAIGPDGTAYVVTAPQDGVDTTSVLRFSSTGTPLGALAVEADYPSSVAVLPNGTIFVGTALDGILVINPDGSTQTIDVGQTTGIAVGTDGRIYAAITTFNDDETVTGSIAVIKRVPSWSLSL